MTDNFSQLVGKTLVNIGRNDEVVYFVTDTHEKYMMYHVENCCEVVRIEDVCGEFEDLLNAPILLAEKVCNDSLPGKSPFEDQMHLWTFYKLATVKGHVTIRFYGESNGWYSVEVTFLKVDTEDKRDEWYRHAYPVFIKDRGANHLSFLEAIEQGADVEFIASIKIDEDYLRELCRALGISNNALFTVVRDAMGKTIEFLPGSMIDSGIESIRSLGVRVDKE